MKFFLKSTLFALVLMSTACFSDVVDVYDLKMTLRIPRVYDNTQSLGYRKIQLQKLKGQLLVRYTDDSLPELTVTNLVNTTHKVNGSEIMCQCYSDEQSISRFNYIGDNRRNQFTRPGMSFSFIADPSYNIGSVQEDNSLYLRLAGYGTSTTKKFAGCRVPNIMHGYVVGNIGCGCADYGHISPTRIVGWRGFTDLVDDVAPVFGTWRIQIRSRTKDR